MRGACRVVVAFALLPARPVHAQGWDLTASFEDGDPGGWVQVRENDIAGTRLDIARDLNVGHMRTLRLRAVKHFSDVGELHLGLSASTLDGSTAISDPVTFNGTTVAPGPLKTITHFQDFLALDASYWCRLHAFDNGGGLWGSAGLTFVLLNFRLQGTIAADSVGNELKEDFYVQELPVPTIGLHFRYPFMNGWSLTADATAARLPWVDSLRSEGGEVRVAQTNEDEDLGVEYDFSSRWDATAYVFHSYFAQHERSGEDGNAIHLRSTGVGIGVGYRF